MAEAARRAAREGESGHPPFAGHRGPTTQSAPGPRQEPEPVPIRRPGDRSDQVASRPLRRPQAAHPVPLHAGTE